MFDVTARLTYKSVPNWHRDLVRVCENIPIVLVSSAIQKNKNVRLLNKRRKGWKQNRCERTKSHCSYDNISPQEESAVSVGDFFSFRLRWVCWIDIMKCLRNQITTMVILWTHTRSFRTCYVFVICLILLLHLRAEKPFLWLARKLVGDPGLTLVEELALLPPEVELDQNQIQAFERVSMCNRNRARRDSQPVCLIVGNGRLQKHSVARRRFFFFSCSRKVLFWSLYLVFENYRRRFVNNN